MSKVIKTIKEMREAGYPLKIKGNGGSEAGLIKCQSLLNGHYCGVYRYTEGDNSHILYEIKKYFQVIEQ